MSMFPYGDPKHKEWQRKIAADTEKFLAEGKKITNVPPDASILKELEKTLKSERKSYVPLEKVLRQRENADDLHEE